MFIIACTHTHTEAEYNPGVNYRFELEFRTLNCSGLLLYSSSYFLSDHTALELSEGSVSVYNYTSSPLLIVCTNFSDFSN